MMHCDFIWRCEPLARLESDVIQHPTSPVAAQLQYIPHRCVGFHNAGLVWLHSSCRAHRFFSVLGRFTRRVSLSLRPMSPLEARSWFPEMNGSETWHSSS